MGATYDVKLWNIRKRPDRGTFQVRWRVGGRPKPNSETFQTLTLAQGRYSELLRSVHAGEPFDDVTGLPMREVRERNNVTWFRHAREYIEMKWPHSPGSTRRTLADAMAAVTPAMVQDTRGMAAPRAVRHALYSWAFNMSPQRAEPPEQVAAVLAWFERKSLPVTALSDRMRLRATLDALTRNLDGGTVAASSIRRRRAIFYNALGFAVEAERLADNPLTQVQWRPPEQVSDEVDPACVPDPGQAAVLLRAVREQSARGRHLVAFFGCMYYAAARPAEVIGLRAENCTLPRRGWGEVRLHETHPRSGSAWTDTGDSHDRRGLKHRPRKASRVVPIPPDLVALLRWHLTAYGAAPDGRLFRTARGGLIQDTGYGEVWAEARRRALTQVQFESPLAKRPYDLRHAAVSTWLSSGVDPQLVAQRAGHSVGVLFRVYAKCLDGSSEAANARIEALLKAAR